MIILKLSFFKSLDEQISNGKFGCFNDSYKNTKFKKIHIIIGFPFVCFEFKTNLIKIKKRRRKL